MLKKECKCGRIIDAGIKMCPECMEKYRKQKAEIDREYDLKVRKLRDIKFTSFYHSKEWLQATRDIKAKFKGLDIYSYYMLGEIEYGKICHHIEVLKSNEGWNNRLNTDDGIILLTYDNHVMVHDMLEQDYKGTVKLMKDLVDRWNREFNR